MGGMKGNQARHRRQAIKEWLKAISQKGIEQTRERAFAIGFNMGWTSGRKDLRKKQKLKEVRA